MPHLDGHILPIQSGLVDLGDATRCNWFLIEEFEHIEDLLTPKLCLELSMSTLHRVFIGLIPHALKSLGDLFAKDVPSMAGPLAQFYPQGPCTLKRIEHQLQPIVKEVPFEEPCEGEC